MAAFRISLPPSFRSPGREHERTATNADTSEEDEHNLDGQSLKSHYVISVNERNAEPQLAQFLSALL